MNTFQKFGGSKGDFFVSRLMPKIILSILSLSLSLIASSQVSVSSGGTPSYSFPIVVPPGIGGMTPNIGLLYSGSAVNGPVGYGWTIQGISTISRCPANKLVDGTGRGVEFSIHDKLCLDGQRLIQTDASGNVVNKDNTSPTLTNHFQQNDSLGGTGQVREYRTDRDIYSRIRAYGSAGGVAANGPAYFRVWTKSGQIYEYGVNANTTSNASITPQGKTVVSSWAVSRISDTVGNFIDFDYVQGDLPSGSVPATGSNLGREWNLSEIRYTGNASQLPKNKVVFEYIERPLTTGAVQDRAETYHQGSKNVSVKLLSRVRTYINWTAGQTPKPANAINVKTIKLTYDNGPITKRSRVKHIAECAGASETVCLPPTTFNYSAGGNSSYTSNAVFSSSTLSTLKMDSATGNYGVITGNFFGSGRTDILRWSDNAWENSLYRSEGNGNFSQVPVGSVAAKFNITDQNLFKSDGCYSSVTSDFNGDGLTDILRLSQLVSATGTSCGITTNLLYTSNGDGSFASLEITGIDFSQVLSRRTYPTNCPIVSVNGGIQDPCELSNYFGLSSGSNYHLLDVNNDGLLDIVTTIVPGYPKTLTHPTLDQQCASRTCTRVFLGKTGGGFQEADTDLKNRSVYADPAKGGSNFWNKPFVLDVNGDGASDLVVDSGVWLSNGTGNFSKGSTSQSSLSCENSLDFNGDGRVDCLNVSANPDWENLYVADGINAERAVTNFNLRSIGELYGSNSQGVQNMGVVLIDMNGDGRTDILRWKDDPAQNVVYLSNGDGSFSLDASFNLTSADYQLRKSDGTSNFIIGDFTGRGSPEILRIKQSPSTTSDANKNLLFVKSDTTPPDQLISVVSGTGLTTTLTWVPLSNSSSGALGKRYTSDLGTPSKASYPIIDVTMPTYVVATSVSDSGVGTSKLTSEYSYTGLKVANDGRGWLGFRETRRQNTAPDGSNLTVFTRYLQSTYNGMASMTETRMGGLNASSPQVLSRSTFVYCDKTAANGAEASATSDVPCPTSARVQRPYLYRSTEEGTDILGNVLPTVTTTNTFKNSGDPEKIVVVTQGTSSTLGLTQTFTKTSTNTYYPDRTDGDAWILGRLEKATVQNIVPDSIASISTSAGGAPNATATQGLPPSGVVVLALTACSSTTPTTSPTAATAMCTVKNIGQTAASSISYSTISGTTISGPMGSCAAGLTCGTVTVTTNTAPGTYAGTLTATSNTGTSTSTAISLVVNPSALTPPVLALTGCNSTTPTTSPTAATTSCSVSNTGQTGVSSIAYSTISGATVSGPMGACAAGATCGTVTVTTNTAAGTYSGTLTATPNTGTAASRAISLVVNSPAATSAVLALTGCNSTTPTTSPTAATTSCSVSNTGQTGVSSIAYSTISGATVSGPMGACAAGATCGTVTVTTNTAAGTYSGTLTATPNAGTAASRAVSLVVNPPAPTPPALALTGCNSTTPTTSPTAATTSCSVSNTGQTGLTSIAYSTISGATVSGPMGSCAAGATCGMVTVTTNTAPGTYSGTLTATPNTGTAASRAVSLVVNPPTATSPALAFTGCNSTTPTRSPTAATTSCSVSNTGQAALSSITYSTISGATVSGPMGACAAGATCGTVTVTTNTAAGTYSGTLTATPNIGTPASIAINLLVNWPAETPELVFTGCNSTSPTTSPTAATTSCTLTNTGLTATNTISYSTIGGATISGPTGSCAGRATCGTVTVTTSIAAGTYSGTLTATPNTGSAASQAISLVVNSSGTPARLEFVNCTSVTPTITPIPATKTCTVVNKGGSAATSIEYNRNVSVNVEGPTGPCLAGAVCGTVKLTTPTTPGRYDGELRIPSPSSDRLPFDLVVDAGTTTTTLTSQQTTVNFFTVGKGLTATRNFNVKNEGVIPATGIRLSLERISGTAGNFIPGTSSCSNTLAPGATCQYSVTYEALCTRGPTSFNAIVSGTNFSPVVINLTAATSFLGACP